jgi:hypothetical protein
MEYFGKDIYLKAKLKLIGYGELLRYFGGAYPLGLSCSVHTVSILNHK